MFGNFAKSLPERGFFATRALDVVRFLLPNQSNTTVHR